MRYFKVISKSLLVNLMKHKYLLYMA